MNKPRFKSWSGGKRPVNKVETVSLLFSDGDVVHKTTAGFYESEIHNCWEHNCQDGDKIIAYRVVK